MRFETRQFDEGRVKQLLLVLESREESLLIDEWLGDCVRNGDDDACMPIKAAVKVSDGGLGEHYIRMEHHANAG